MASSIVKFVKPTNYESLNSFSSYLKTISKIFYCEFKKVYVSVIYSPNCDLKLWIIFEFGNLLHRFIDHTTFLYIKACKKSAFLHSKSMAIYIVCPETDHALQGPGTNKWLSYYNVGLFAMFAKCPRPECVRVLNFF